MQPTSSFLDARLRSHAEQREDAAERVQQEFIEALHSRISELMDLTRGVNSNDELNSGYEAVKPFMSVIRSFFSIPEMLSPMRFKMRYDQAQFWVDMRRTQVEEAARNQEREDLLEFSRALNPNDSLEVYTKLQPWIEYGPEFDQSRGVRLKADIVAILKPSVKDQLISLLGRRGSMRKLSEVGRLPAFVTLIFGGQEWDSEVKMALTDALDSSDDAVMATENAEALAGMFLDTLAFRSSSLDTEYMLKFASDEGLMKLFWGALNWRGCCLGDASDY